MGAAAKVCVVNSNPKRVAQAFGRAAEHYDEWAGVQWQAGQRLIDLACSQEALGPGRLIDLGCGSGRLTAELSRREPAVQVFGLDWASGMTAWAQSHQTEVAGWMQADMCCLPLENGSCDSLFSNFAIQWLEEPERLWREASRVLKPGGALSFTTLLPGTLGELAQSWKQVDGSERVNRFLPANRLHQGLLDAGFLGRWLEEDFRAYYPDVRTLMKSFKGVGANTVLQGDTHTPRMTRQSLKALAEVYEFHREAKGLPVRYRVYFGCYQKPVHKEQTV